MCWNILVLVLFYDLIIWMPAQVANAFASNQIIFTYIPKRKSPWVYPARSNNVMTRVLTGC